jgi:hypothetical protein
MFLSTNGKNVAASMAANDITDSSTISPDTLAALMYTVLYFRCQELLFQTNSYACVRPLVTRAMMVGLPWRLHYQR